MNIYAHLMELTDRYAKYEYGPSPDELTGFLIFDRKNGVLTVEKEAEGLIMQYAFRSFIGRMSTDFESGIFKEKYARVVI